MLNRDPKKMWPLEFKDEGQRKEVTDIMNLLMNLDEVRDGMMNFDSSWTAHARSDAVMALAKQLLGRDWDCCVLC